MSSKKLNTWQGSTIYQIYLRSFQDSNNDGIGDIQGIIKRLDYLRNEKDGGLGIDTIWISPMYPSPMVDFGYDVSDYCNIDPMFGTLEYFDLLVKEAHARNIKIMMDYIPSHTSTQHPWFLESKKSKDNLKSDWYIWKDAKSDGSPPNNWLSVFGGSRWEFDNQRGQYYLHSFLREQADLNWRNPDVEKAMLDVLRFWLDRGVDGFRVDAYDYVYKDERFLDEPPNPKYREGKDSPFESLLPIYTSSQEDLFSLLKKFNDLISAYGEKFMITESYVETDQLVKLYKASTHLHAPFNFQFITLKWDAQVFKKFIDDFDSHVGDDYLPTYVLGNHDRSRLVTRLGPKAARAAAVLQLTLRGIPTIYYGEELGMIDREIPSDLVQDPFEKQVPGLGLGRDPERTPMQWDSSLNAGFTQGKPWLPVNDNYKDINVAKEESDSHSMLTLYRKLFSLRKENEAIKFGTYESLDLGNKDVFAYVRSKESEKILVVINFSDREQKVYLPFSNIKLRLTSRLDHGLEYIQPNLILGSNDALIFSIQN